DRLVDRLVEGGQLANAAVIFGCPAARVARRELLIYGRLSHGRSRFGPARQPGPERRPGAGPGASRRSVELSGPDGRGAPVRAVRRVGWRIEPAWIASAPPHRLRRADRVHRR